MKDFQCVPKTENTVMEASASNAGRNGLITISVVMFVVAILLLALLLWFRSRQKNKVIPVKEAQKDNNDHAKDDVKVYDL